MPHVLNLARRKWVSLVLSLLFCIPIVLFLGSKWVSLPDELYSVRKMVFVAFGIFALLIWGIWLVIDKFLGWLKSKQIKASLQDYILLLIASISVAAAIYSGWVCYSSKEIPNKLFSKFKVEVGSPGQSKASGDVCILELVSQDGKKIRPENSPISGFMLSGGWVVKSPECQYFLPKGTQGNLRFYQTGKLDDVFQILFRENKDSGKVLIRVNGQRIAEPDLHNALEGNKLISVPLQFSNREILFWNLTGTASSVAVLAMLGMILVLSLQNTQLPAQIVTLFDWAKKHPWIGLVPLCTIAAVLFWPRGASISPDVGYYLSLAKNLYYGNGYVNPDLSPNIYRGPIFPLLISFSYMLFGESFRSAIILERIFWFLTILISYVLGRYLYNHRVGFLAAFFILTAVVINQAFIHIWTDGPLTFAILALQLMFWQAFIGQRDGKWYALMGAFMGITYLLKQTVIFIAPLPLLLWVVFSEYRTTQIFKRILVFYFVFAVIYFGWDGYVYLAGGSSEQVMGTLHTGINFLSYISRGSSFVNTGQTPPQGGIARSFLMSFLEIISTFYTRDVLRFFKIAVMFPVSIIFLLYQAVIQKTKPDIFLALGIVLYSPLILVQAVVNFGYRQNLYFYCIVLICIAAILDRVFSKLSFMELSKALVVVVAFSLICIQVSGGNYDFPQLVPFKDEKRLPFLGAYQQIAAWVDKRIALDTKIMIPMRESNFLHILTAGNRHFEIINTCMGETNFSPATKCIPPYISFWVYRGTTDPNEPRDFLQGISEPVLLSTIREKNIKYIFITPSIYSLYFYLRVHPDFEEVDIIDNIAIFRVIRPVHPIADYQNVEWEPCIGRGTAEYLKNLQETDPTRFEMRLQSQIGPWMGLNRRALDAFINWQGCQFEVAFPGSYRME